MRSASVAMAARGMCAELLFFLEQPAPTEVAAGGDIGQDDLGSLLDVVASYGLALLAATRIHGVADLFDHQRLGAGRELLQASGVDDLLQLYRDRRRQVKA